MNLWGGRFGKAMDSQMHRLNASLPFDWRLYDQDITGSVAWARALARAGILRPEECETIIGGLEVVRHEFSAGKFGTDSADEDIHSAVERRLVELVGPVGGKLHTARSRNDQVATDLRIYLLDAISTLEGQLTDLLSATLDQAEKYLGVIMPGYTHLQQAQPVLFSHWLMSYFAKLWRDSQRLQDTAKRTAVLPLGSGALAGSPFPIDRHALAAELGFHTVASNSLDAVGDRDFVVEFIATAALIQVHLSNLAEDLVIWSSREFQFVELDESFTTCSSLMPQKKNPDSLELVRGKTGRVVGNLTGLLTTLKGLPSAYNKDLQEDKEGLFDTIDTLSLELPVVTGVIRSLHVNSSRMEAALESALLATDLADTLVRQGIPFRQAHHLVGRAVRRAEALGVSLKGLELQEYQQIHSLLDESLYSVLDFQHSVRARDSQGGTAPVAVQAQIKQARELLADRHEGSATE